MSGLPPTADRLVAALADRYRIERELGQGGPNYDVSADGTRIVAILSAANDFQLVVSPNWITEFRRRIAESRSR